MASARKIIIIGATSGIGYEITQLYRKQGWRIGIAGRRTELLAKIRSEAPDQIETAQIDVTSPDAPEKLAELIDRVGGMDVFLLSSGIGSQNRICIPILNCLPSKQIQSVSPKWSLPHTITSNMAAAN